VGIQEFRWDKGGMEPAYNNTFSYGNGNAEYHLRQTFSSISESD